MIAVAIVTTALAAVRREMNVSLPQVNLEPSEHPGLSVIRWDDESLVLSVIPAHGRFPDTINGRSDGHRLWNPTRVGSGGHRRS